MAISLFPIMAIAAHDERVVVTGKHQDMGLLEQVSHTAGGEVGTFIRQVPGGELNTNGQLSGVLQYRGLFGNRISVSIDQVPVTSVGPNFMDPPLHYVHKVLLESVEFDRGISSVSRGGGIGGHADAKLRQSEFVDGNEFEMHGVIGFLGHSADNGYNGGFLLGSSNNRHRFHVFGGRDNGDDVKAGAGEISYTEYDRDTYGVGYGTQLDGHEFSVDYRKVDTDDAGTPSLPMDIDYFRGDFGNTRYWTQWNDMDIGIKIHHHDVEHGMSNYHIRNAPDFDNLSGKDSDKLGPFQGDDKRRGTVSSDGMGFAFDMGHPLYQGYLKMGLDAYNTDHSMDISDPDFAQFFVKSINHAEVDRVSLFAEWAGSVSERWRMEAGIRYQNTQMSAGRVDALPAVLERNTANGISNPVTQGTEHLRQTFNAADRRRTEDDIDAVLKFFYAQNDDLIWSLAVARKTRAPSYIERYIWLPLEITSGLGDGNNYVGNPDLESEFSHELELGLDWQHKKLSISPRIYHRWVNNYIQGLDLDCNDAEYGQSVCQVSNLANGDATPKQFTNVDANIYGADIAFQYQFNADWQVDGIASYTRGRRDDISDNLFRISPHKLQVSLTRQMSRGNVVFEAVIVDEQDKLAKSLLDPDNLGGLIDTGATSGYVLFNLDGRYHFSGNENVMLSLGVGNILDKHYEDHLSSFNRAAGGDVAVGERLPGVGRNLFLNLVYEW